jgi:lipopolysaccharide/colanic/teichoic acid biosynthesis glycosyltransferase
MMADPEGLWLKRAFDLALCIAAMPLLAPLCLLIALAVRIDSPGPVLFRHVRTGRNGTRFTMYKFRTMVRNAEELKASLAHLNIAEPPAFKIIDDPRITSVGRVLRATSLDELPQIFNVLAGQMSLVGPRPTSYGPASYRLWHTERLEVPPGMTGLWQVSGRHEVLTVDDRVRLDLEYVRHRSMLADVRILFRTVGAVVHRSGA